ncbi:unnamed protein product [Protopolystoma xenopodis]|uniref:Uncharacterized protein n=1 Tax=Protopolystoma xenopodis TaxID=117903 RepID=A0A448XHK9_9PLAT|nr:unnamed protein product [Protopolystoma xenopodis]
MCCLPEEGNGTSLGLTELSPGDHVEWRQAGDNVSANHGRVNSSFGVAQALSPPLRDDWRAILGRVIGRLGGRHWAVYSTSPDWLRPQNAVCKMGPTRVFSQSLVSPHPSWDETNTMIGTCPIHKCPVLQKPQKD